MTTIVWDGHRIASDSQSSNGFINQEPQQKIFEQPNNIIAISGFIDYYYPIMALDFSDLIKVAQLMFEKWPMNNEPHFTFLYSNFIDNYIYSYTHGDISMLKRTAPYAIGSGKAYAMGALIAGVSAVKAIHIAAQLDLHTNDKIQEYDIIRKSFIPHL